MQVRNHSNKNQSLSSLSEINVTPFVDVMLVLLIIFMVAAPLMQQGIEINLPKANTGNLDKSSEEIMLVIKKNQTILINGNVLPKGTLFEKMSGIAATKPDVRVFVQADASIPYGFLALVIAEVKRAKVFRVGLVTQPTTKDSNI